MLNHSLFDGAYKSCSLQYPTTGIHKSCMLYFEWYYMYILAYEYYQWIFYLPTTKKCLVFLEKIKLGWTAVCRMIHNFCLDLISQHAVMKMFSKVIQHAREISKFNTYAQIIDQNHGGRRSWKVTEQNSF